MTNHPSSEPSYFKKSLQFLSDYFLNSNDKWKAWALLSGCVFLSLAMIGLGFILGWWFFPYIYAAFVVKDTALLLIGLGAGLLISGAMAGCNYLINFLKNELYVNWRSWLSKKIINQYLKGKMNYLEISRIYNNGDNNNYIDNPEQRIQEDIGHRSTLRRHHDNILFFNVNDTKEVHIEEEHAGQYVLPQGDIKSTHHYINGLF